MIFWLVSRNESLRPDGRGYYKAHVITRAQNREKAVALAWIQLSGNPEHYDVVALTAPDEAVWIHVLCQTTVTPPEWEDVL